MTDCEIDNNDTKLMQLSNDLNSYCVNESINSDNTDLVDLDNKCLNGGLFKHLLFNSTKSLLSLYMLSFKHL
jgi:hypothetical protein